jgi:YVTN family beta-propeller protein
MAPPELEFRVLGPLEVRRDGVPVALGGLRQRALLAILLLNANRVVSRGRLIEELQGETADADRVLRVQMSRLRKALENGAGDETRLVTQPPGYRLRVEAGELDLARFSELVATGRAALDQGAHEAAVAAFGAADSLWRGAALEGLETERFAVGEIAHLSEARLAAIEERIDAELALGRHGRLIAELEARVGEHPVRERLRAQQMLALYRSGRQADALAAYRSARGLLSQELGIEPGPELRTLEAAVLRQDPALDLPAAPAAAPVPAASPPPAPPGPDPAVRRRPPWLVPATALAAAAAAALLAVTLLSDADGISPVDGNALVQLGGGDRRPIAATELDAAPTRVASGAGALWVTHVDAASVSRVDPETRTVRQTVRVGRGPAGIAVAVDDVWVANSADGTVSRIDAATNQVVQTIAVGARPGAVAAAGRAVYVANRADATLVRLDALSGKATTVIDTGSDPSDVAVRGEIAWVSNQGDGTVSRIDVPSGDAVQTIKVGNGPSGLAVTPGGVWVVNALDATVSRIEPQRGIVTATIPVGARPGGIWASGTSVWVSDTDTGRVLEIDARRGVVARSVVVGNRAGPLVDGPAGRWVGVASGGARHAGGTLTIASTLPEVRSLDPAVLDDITPLALLGMTNDGLLTLNHVGGPDGGQVVPDLAVAVPSPSDAGRTYTFRLRRGIPYSSGAAVSPRDVRRSFERLFELESAGRSFYDRIVGADACRPGTRCDLSRGIVLDERGQTVTFRLTSPDPDFLHKLTLGYAFVLPASTPSRAAQTPLPATGPYVIRHHRPGREIRLERNPRFHVWSQAAQPEGYPDAIVWRLGQPAEAAATAVIHGRADLMPNNGGPPPTRVEALRTRFPAQLRSNPAMGTDFFFLNTRAAPFDDVRVRRAVNYALDRNRTVAIHGGPGAATPTCQLLPPQMPGFRSYCPYTRGGGSDGRWRGPDLARARRLVDASGTRGMRVRVWSTPTPAIARDQGRYVTQLLRRLGYRASLRLLPDDEFLRYTDNSRNRAQVVSGGWGADYPSPSAFIGKLTCRGFIPNSESTFNTGQFCDPAFDRKVARAEALQVTNRAQALAAWSRLDRELTARAVWLPTATGTVTDVVSERVGNYQFHPFWGVLVDQLWVR